MNLNCRIDYLTTYVVNTHDRNRAKTWLTPNLFVSASLRETK